MYNESVAAVFNILTASRLRGNIHCSYQHFQPGKITLQVSVLMIEYLVAMSYECVIMSIAVEIVIEKSGICVW